MLSLYGSKSGSAVVSFKAGKPLQHCVILIYYSLINGSIAAGLAADEWSEMVLYLLLFLYPSSGLPTALSSMLDLYRARECLLVFPALSVGPNGEENSLLCV